MPLVDFDDFPRHAAHVYRDVSDPDNYDDPQRFEKVSEVEVVVVERGGAEAFRLGLSVATKLRTVFCDLVDDTEPGTEAYLTAPFTTSDSLRVRGETLDVISIRRITAGGERLCIAECQVS